MQDANPKPAAPKPCLHSLKERCDRLPRERLTEALPGLVEASAPQKARYLQWTEREA